MEERQLLLNTLEQEEKIALALVAQRNQELNNWNTKHDREVVVNEKRILYAQENLREVRQKIEEAKKDKDPARTVSYNNQKLAADKKLRYQKGCAVNDDDVASLIGRSEVILAIKMALPLIQGGKFAGRPFVTALLEQLVLNALVQISFDNFRNISPKEVLAAMSKWPI